MTVLMIRLMLVNVLCRAVLATWFNILPWILLATPVPVIVPLSDPAMVVCILVIPLLSWVMKIMLQLSPVKILMTFEVTALALMIFMVVIGCIVELRLAVDVFVVRLSRLQKFRLAPLFAWLVVTTRPRTGVGVRRCCLAAVHRALSMLHVALTLTPLSSVSGLTGQL